jgi:putative transposase
MTSIVQDCALTWTFHHPLNAPSGALNQIIEWREKTQAIRVDNGPEYISGTLMA